MKKLIGFLFILVVGVMLGYFFHNPIDTKLKTWFGTEKVERANTTVHNGAKTGKKLLNKGVNAGKTALNNIKK